MVKFEENLRKITRKNGNNYEEVEALDNYLLIINTLSRVVSMHRNCSILHFGVYLIRYLNFYRLNTTNIK